MEGCGYDSLQGDVKFAVVMGKMGAHVEWSPTSIKIKGESLSSHTPTHHHSYCAIEQSSGALIPSSIPFE